MGAAASKQSYGSPSDRQSTLDRNVITTRNSISSDFMQKVGVGSNKLIK